MDSPGYSYENNVILIDRSLTKLDLFVKNFLEIFKQHVDYLIVSGYVSICTGRTRGTEDIDLICPIMPAETFRDLFNNLIKGGFWCYQGDNADKVYEYVKEGESIRFALQDEMFPNMEVIPFTQKNILKKFEFEHPQKIRINGFTFKIPPLEFEILYKEEVLKGQKDIEDANHLRVLFKNILDKEKLKAYKELIRKYSP